MLSRCSQLGIGSKGYKISDLPTYEKVDAAYQILDLWISEYEKTNFYQWMIVLKGLGEPIGSISVVGQNDQIEEAVGQGDGLRLCHFYTFLSQLFVRVHANNHAAKPHTRPMNPFYAIL